jgi:hypothetical protein
MSHSGQMLLTFVIGGVVGLLVGWSVARARYAPASEDPVAATRNIRNEAVTFLKNAVVFAVAVVVVLFLAANIVHSRR